MREWEIRMQDRMKQTKRQARVTESMTVMEKLKILSDAAKYDVACTSSGTSR